ncbi:MAG: tetratricopeptide repeat protein, partial [Phycisphaerales bacterium]
MPDAAVDTVRPSGRQAKIDEAWARLEQREFDAAEQLLLPLADREDVDASVLYNLGVCAFEAGRFEDAADRFERAAVRGDAQLVQRAMFNRGTALLRSAIAQSEADGGGAEGVASGSSDPPGGGAAAG